jgi:hypothetical protein
MSGVFLLSKLLLSASSLNKLGETSWAHKLFAGLPGVSLAIDQDVRGAVHGLVGASDWSAENLAGVIK